MDWLGLQAGLPSYGRCEMRPRPAHGHFQTLRQAPHRAVVRWVAIVGLHLAPANGGCADQLLGFDEWIDRETLADTYGPPQLLNPLAPGQFDREVFRG